MNKVRKAIIPCAGLGTRFLPVTKNMAKEMLPIIDTPTIQLIVEEAIESGIEEILIITNTSKPCPHHHCPDIHKSCTKCWTDWLDEEHKEPNEPEN